MNPKYKILHVITQGEWGGAERYVFDLVANLGSNFEVIVAVGEPKGRQDLQDRLKQTGRARVIQLFNLVRRISPFRDIGAVFELAKLYKQIRPDIVHLNSSKTGIIGSLARLFVIRHSICVVYTVHGWIFNEPLPWFRKKIYFFLEKWTARLKDGFIMLSSLEAEQSKTLLKIPPEKIVIIPHGVAAPAAPLSKAEARNELLKKTGIKISAKGIWIGAIANYYKTKGLDILIQALAHKKNALPSISCILIGEGPERPRLAELIAALELDAMVHLAGTVTGAARFLPAFDLFVLPSRKEGLPYSLLEALAAGVPAVAAAVGALPSIIANKKNGLVVPPEDKAALAEAIEFSLRHLAELRPNMALPTLKEEIERTTSWYRQMLRPR